ncbi:serine hydrolase domain-containing protein [Pedomonas mirosovicensis]|uniref:serine hydrolase domain-containing protein n=1 Tax=Pedomonas mirosovicensis TaxID=2908641 RepID=UPI0021684442|nr:serine hydrolase [Pedomonas mirosovicensis]MCH8685171.1 beta-lactamase family protein [Pedomonas mirosovicensis]
MAAAAFIRAGLFGAGLAALCAGAVAQPSPQDRPAKPQADVRHPIAVSDIKLPDPARLLFWTPDEQRFGYSHMERLFPGQVVARGKTIRPLPRAGQELAVRYSYNGAPWDTARFMANNDVAGLLVLHDGRIVLERYGLGLDEKGRWTSFSMAKSVTSTLIGAALKDGAIKSLDEPVTRYLPALKGTAYDGATLRHLLTMTSGVRWNENYADPQSDVNRLARIAEAAAQGKSVTPGETAPGGGKVPPLVAFMGTLPRAHAPGTVFNYNTAETGLLGEVIRAATGKPVAAYLSEKLWAPLGMEQDGFWVTDKRGPEGRAMTGCCLSASLRDYGRFGQFILAGGKVGGKSLLPEGWVGEATGPRAPLRGEGQGYGYQWWTVDGAGFEARGVFGQNIRIWPEKKLVVVTLSAWPRAGDPERSKARLAYIRAVAEAVETGAAKAGADKT